MIIIAIVLAGCNATETKSSSENIESEIITETDDTIAEIGIREVQSVPDDPDSSYEKFDVEKKNEFDFSWVPTESDLFLIILEEDEIIFNSYTLKEVNVSYRIETSITVMDEGPHCDLINWKHGATSWEKLEQIPEYNLEELNYTHFEFKINPRTKEGTLPFPTVEMDEIKQAVKNSCGSVWSDLLNNAKTHYESPCAVGISAYIFRVEIIQPEGKKNSYKYLKIPVDMGC